MYKIRKKSLKTGFTLVELLIYCGLLLIFLTMLTSIFISTLEVHSQAYSRSIVQQDGQFIMQRLMYDVRRAQQIVTPANPGDQANTLTLIINGETYTYAINAGRLELTNLNGNSQLNFSQTSVSNFNVLKLANLNGLNTVKINFTVSSNLIDASGTKEESFNFTVANSN